MNSIIVPNRDYKYIVVVGAGGFGNKIIRVALGCVFV